MVELVSKIFAGQPAEAVGAALGDLVATFIAGHVILDDNRQIKRSETEKVREVMLEQHVELVKDLIPENEREILKRLRKTAS
jgi:hypothetical protein